MQTASAQSALARIAARFRLPSSAYVRLLAVKSEHARTFYETEALRAGWSVRQRDRHIHSQFYERTALSRNKAAMLTKGARPQPGDAMSLEEEVKDPYVLEFLDLHDEYSETDLEAALIRHLETFLLELGGDFCFVYRTSSAGGWAASERSPPSALGSPARGVRFRLVFESAEESEGRLSFDEIHELRRE